MTDSEKLSAILDHVASWNDMQAFWSGFGAVFTIGVGFLCYKLITKTYSDDDF